VCRRDNLTQAEAIECITAVLTRPPRGCEIEEAVIKAYNHSCGRHTSPGSKAPYDEEKLKAVTAKQPDFSADSYIARSPVDVAEIAAASFLQQLFEPGERVLVFNDYKSQGQILWKCPDPEEVFDPDALAHISKPPSGNGGWFLSNPVTGEWLSLDRCKSKRNPEGRTRRSEENLTSCRYLLLESDKAPTDLWLRALAQLPLPIVSVVTSGGESVHALVRVDASDQDEWLSVKNLIARVVGPLGACHGSLTLVRLTRLPGCWRSGTGGFQKALFLNPKADGTPIASLPERTPTQPEPQQ
jgi:hypothetical protein